MTFSLSAVAKILLLLLFSAASTFAFRKLAYAHIDVQPHIQIDQKIRQLQMSFDSLETAIDVKSQQADLQKKNCMLWKTTSKYAAAAQWK